MKKIGTKNRLSDLNDHLFMQIERLGNEALTPEQIDAEVKRGVAIAAAADQIIRSAMVQIAVAKVISDHGGIDPRPYLPRAVDPAEDLKVVSHDETPARQTSQQRSRAS